MILFLLSAVFGNIFAASQDLSAEGKKNLRSANMHLSGERYEKALPFYEDVLAENPHNIEALKKVGSIYFDVKKDYKIAYGYFVQVENEIAEIYAEYDQLKQQDEKEADKFYKKEIKKADLEKIKEELGNLLLSCWAKMFNEAKGYFDNEDYETALDKYLYVYEMAPDSIQTVKMLSYTYNKLNNTEKSLEYMKISADMDPTDDVVRTNIGNIMFEQGNYEKAVKWYAAAAEINFSIIDNFYNMALAYSRLGDEVNEGIAFEKVLEIEPDNLDAIINVSNIALKAGDYEKSLTYLKRAAVIDSTNKEIISNLCYKLAQEKRFEEVLEYAQKWKELDPNSENAQQMINLAKQNLKK